MAHDECNQEGKIQALCEFKGATESDLKTLFNLMSEIKNNDLKHINMKINTLLFTVLGSVFAAVIVIAVKFITGMK